MRSPETSLEEDDATGDVILGTVAGAGLFALPHGGDADGAFLRRRRGNHRSLRDAHGSPLHIGAQLANSHMPAVTPGFSHHIRVAGKHYSWLGARLKPGLLVPKRVGIPVETGKYRD